jgi:RNA polymerase sigma factor (sigma-70 family)
MSLELSLNSNPDPRETELAQESTWIAQSRLDRQAFASLYDRYFPRVYNYMRLRSADALLADDLTAQVFERALLHLGSYDPREGVFAAWLFGIARNLWSDHLRRERRQAWLSLAAIRPRAHGDPSPEESLIQAETQQALQRALQSLSERERDLLALKFAGGMTNRQIASLVGLSESNVGVFVFRALQRLRARLQGPAG